MFLFVWFFCCCYCCCVCACVRACVCVCVCVCVYWGEGWGVVSLLLLLLVMLSHWQWFRSSPLVRRCLLPYNASAFRRNRSGRSRSRNNSSTVTSLSKKTDMWGNDPIGRRLCQKAVQSQYRNLPDSKVYHGQVEQTCTTAFAMGKKSVKLVDLQTKCIRERTQGYCVCTAVFFFYSFLKYHALRYQEWTDAHVWSCIPLLCNTIAVHAGS